ncbi:hypothetical protein D3C75_708720 [compost metagenome]
MDNFDFHIALFQIDHIDGQDGQPQPFQGAPDLLLLEIQLLPFPLDLPGKILHHLGYPHQLLRNQLAALQNLFFPAQIMTVQGILLLHHLQHLIRPLAGLAPFLLNILPGEMLVLLNSSHHFRHELVGIVELSVPALLLLPAGHAAFIGHRIHEMADLFLLLPLHSLFRELAEALGQLLEHLGKLLHPPRGNIPHPFGIFVMALDILLSAGHIFGQDLNRFLRRQQEQPQGHQRFPRGCQNRRLIPHIHCKNGAAQQHAQSRRPLAAFPQETGQESGKRQQTHLVNGVHIRQAQDQSGNDTDGSAQRRAAY